MMGACIDAMRNPTKPRPEGEVILAEMVRQYVINNVFFSERLQVPLMSVSRFWERALTFATPLGAEWFVEVFTEYLSSVVEVAEWRDRGSPELTLEEYVAIRIKDVGVLPTQAIGGLYFSLPESVLSHPTVCEAMRIGCELTMIDNVSPAPSETETQPLTLTLPTYVTSRTSPRTTASKQPASGGSTSSRS